MAFSKIILNSATLVDLTTDTVTSANHIINGYIGHLADGTQVTGTGSGDESTTYRLDNIIPQQDVTTSESISYGYVGTITDYSEIPVYGEMYLVTFDGTEYVTQGYNASSTEVVIGDYRVVISSTVNRYLSYPFLIDYESPNLALATRDTNTHTIKVDKLVFLSEGQTFITKEITANGTYNASDDSVDGYSSVTVDISSSSGGQYAQTATGTVTGSGSTTVEISCDFAPDIIYLYGDLSSSTSNRGVISFTIIKDAVMYLTTDASTSSATESGAHIAHNISGYGITSEPHAEYSNNILTIDTVSNTSAFRFLSEQTYTYKLIKYM